jgi:hypothetical protein
MDHQLMVDLARDYARQRPFLQFASMFNPQKVVGHSKVRVGSEGDGGYVMLDDFAEIDLALSFGVDINADWDLDIATRGVSVQQYDHSVPQAPIDHPKITFFKQMIAAGDQIEGAISIDTILRQANIEKDNSVILKMDIESSEWPVLEACTADVLKHFSQVLVEFHDIDRAVDAYWMRRATAVMKNLDEMFGVYHVHANNWSPMAVIGNVYFPSTIEVSFANRRRYQFEPSNEIFPTALDRPNNPLRPDIYLGTFRYEPLSTHSA